MKDTQAHVSARAAGTFDIGGESPVNRLGFGAMRLTGEGIWGEPRDPEECKRVLRRAVELDVNLIDTADSYGPGVSERLIAEALYPYPSDLVIATKGGLTRSGPNQWHPDGPSASSRRRSTLSGSTRTARAEASTRASSSNTAAATPRCSFPPKGPSGPLDGSCRWSFPQRSSQSRATTAHRPTSTSPTDVSAPT